MSFVLMPEKLLITLIYPFGYFLNGLRTQFVPAVIAGKPFEFGYMFLENEFIEAFMI